MGATEESPLEEVLRPLKRRKRVQLTFCRSLQETPPKASPRCTSSSHASSSLAEPRKKLYDRELDSNIVSTTATSSHLDLRFLLVCDAISRDFLLPYFSFNDLFALSRCSKAIRDVICQKRWWKLKVEEFRRSDERADELISRYSSSASTLRHPDYHMKMISKYLNDTANVVSNLKAASCRKCCKAFSLELTCHKAFAVHESAKVIFLQEEADCVVMEVAPNKCKRSVELRPLRIFPVVQTEQYCSLLASHRQLLFHVTHQQLHVWNWQNEGQRVDVSSPSEMELMGLGLARAVIVREDHLIIASNDAGHTAAEPSTGAALVQIWRIDYSRFEGKNELSFSLDGEISERPQKTEMPTEFGAVVGMKPSSVALDGDSTLLGIAYGLYCFSQFAPSIATGKITFYDLVVKKPLGRRSFSAAASCVRVNAAQRKAIVGFEKRSDQGQSYVTIVDVDTGDTLKQLRSKLWGPRCLWTDWKRLIFTGDDDGLLVWDVLFGVDDVGEKRLVDVDEAMATYLSGCNGLPTTDRICDLVFDGFHLIVYTRGGVKATVRILDFLKLSSVKF